MSQNILTNFRSLKNGIAIASVYITTVQEIGQYLAERLFSHQTLVKWPLEQFIKAKIQIRFARTPTRTSIGLIQGLFYKPVHSLDILLA